MTGSSDAKPVASAASICVEASACLPSADSSTARAHKTQYSVPASLVTGASSYDASSSMKSGPSGLLETGLVVTGGCHGGISSKAPRKGGISARSSGLKLGRKGGISAMSSGRRRGLPAVRRGRQAHDGHDVRRGVYGPVACLALPSRVMAAPVASEPRSARPLAGRVC